MARREGRSPKCNPLRIHAGKCSRIVHGLLPVMELPTHGDKVAWLSVRCPKVSVVKREHMEPGGGKALRIRFKPHSTRGAEATRHDYARRAGMIGKSVAGRTVVPCAAGNAITFEFHISAVIQAHFTLVRGNTCENKRSDLLMTTL